MKTDLLFPHKYRKVGMLLLVPLLFFVIVFNLNAVREYLDNHHLGVTNPNWSVFQSTANNVLIIGISTSLLFIAFAREKIEDEMIWSLRLQALQWSVYVNYVLLAICALAFYDLNFFTVLICNLFTVLIVFIIMFRWTLYRAEKQNMI